MSAQATFAIEANGLVKSFGDTRAVDGVDLAVPRGAVYGVLGPNGAGKTTTIRMLATLLRPDAGSAHVLGHDIVARGRRGARPGQPDRPARVGRRGPDRPREPDPARPPARLLAPRRSKERAAELLEAFGLADAASRLVKNYSGGMRRRLDIAASIVVTPELMFLDEPTTGPRPALAQPGLGHHPRPRRRGHDGPAVHAVPRRGRPARGADRGDRPRQGDRRGHARRSSRPRSARARCTSALLDPEQRDEAERVLARALDARCTSRPTRPRCRCRSPDAERASEAVAELFARRRSAVATSRSASPASTRSSSR